MVLFDTGFAFSVHSTARDHLDFPRVDLLPSRWQNREMFGTVGRLCNEEGFEEERVVFHGSQMWVSVA